MHTITNHDPFAGSDACDARKTSAKKLEADLLALSKEDQKLVKEIDVFVQKLNTRAGAMQMRAGVSSLSSACTSVCFSSGSTVCPQDAASIGEKDPETAKVFVNLYRRGIETLGEARFMDKIIEEAGRHEPVKLVEEAMEKMR